MSVFGWFLQRKVKAGVSEIPRLTFAVGDIHGRVDLLEKMIAAIRSRVGPSQVAAIVFLGDYVDRGDNSSGVLDRLIELRREEWCDLTLLMGNHEEAMLKFLDDPASGPSWCEYGGSVTLASYGVSIPQLRSDQEAWVETSEAFKRELPQSHRDLLGKMDLFFISGDYLFVHAGVNPDKPVGMQGPETFLWIRSAFLTVDKSCDYVVVHGHTPDAEPANKRWRIGLDTGAYATGVLTAVRLEGGDREILQVR